MYAIYKQPAIFEREFTYTTNLLVYGRITTVLCIFQLCLHFWILHSLAVISARSVFVCLAFHIHPFILWCVYAVIKFTTHKITFVCSFIFATPSPQSVGRLVGLARFRCSSTIFSVVRWWIFRFYLLLITFNVFHLWQLPYTNACIHTLSEIDTHSAERTKQWKLIESINENMNNEGGSFTFSGAIFGVESILFCAYVYVRACVRACMCVYVCMVHVLYVGRLTLLFFNVRACLNGSVFCSWKCLKIQQSYISDLTWFILARFAFTMCMFCLLAYLCIFLLVVFGFGFFLILIRLLHFFFIWLQDIFLMP